MTDGTEYLRAADIAQITGVSIRPALDCRRDHPLDQARGCQARRESEPRSPTFSVPQPRPRPAVASWVELSLARSPGQSLWLSIGGGRTG
jgi:hypothetical protein